MYSISGLVHTCVWKPAMVGQKYNHREVAYPEKSQKNQAIYTLASGLWVFPYSGFEIKVTEWETFCLT